MFAILTLLCLQVACCVDTRVVTLQLLTFTVLLCCLTINMLGLFFFCTCSLDSSLEVSDNFFVFSYKYNLTFPCFCKYLLLKTEIMEVFIIFEFSDESIIFSVIKTCNQLIVLISSMKSFCSFAKNHENMMCIFGDCRWHSNILSLNIGRVSSEIAPMHSMHWGQPPL